MNRWKPEHCTFDWAGNEPTTSRTQGKRNDHSASMSSLRSIHWKEQKVFFASRFQIQKNVIFDIRCLLDRQSGPQSDFLFPLHANKIDFKALVFSIKKVCWERRKKCWKVLSNQGHIQQKNKVFMVRSFSCLRVQQIESTGTTKQFEVTLFY